MTKRWPDRGGACDGARSGAIAAGAAAATGVLVCVLILLAGECRTGAGAASGIDAAGFLRQYGAFSRGDLEKLARGETVAKTLDADAPEVAICAAVQIAVPPAFYLERFRAIESFKRGDNVAQIGRFGATPSGADAASLTLPPNDVRDLETCRPGDCDVKLDAAGIERLRSAVGADGDSAAANDAFREYIAEYARRYLSGGNAALMTYHDHDKPVSVAEELRHIVRRSPYLAQELRPLDEAIGGFAGAPVPDADSFIYWSSEHAAPRPVISLTHVSIASPQDGLVATTSKQIYASHYFTASLGLTLLADSSTDAARPLTTVIYVNRSRVDAFGGLFGGFKRSVARSRARAGAETMLRDLAARLAREYRASDRDEFQFLPPATSGRN